MTDTSTRIKHSKDGTITSAGDRTVAGISHAVLIVWSAIVILPMVWVVLQSFKGKSEVLSSPFGLPEKWHFSNYYTVWVSEGMGRSFLNTVFVVGSALIVVMALGAMCAYVLARFHFFGSRLIYYAMLAGLTFPIFLAVVPLFFVLQNMYLLNTLPGLALTYVAFALPFTVFFLYAFFQGLPSEIGEAAQIDGAGKWRTFFQVMAPMAKPGIAAVTIMNFLGLWNQYLLPVALNTNQENYVLTQSVARFAVAAGYAVDFGSMFAAFVIVVVPVLIVYIFLQRQLQGSVSQGTSK